MGFTGLGFIGLRGYGPLGLGLRVPVSRSRSAHLYFVKGLAFGVWGLGLRSKKLLADVRNLI